MTTRETGRRRRTVLAQAIIHEGFQEYRGGREPDALEEGYRPGNRDDAGSDQGDGEARVRGASRSGRWQLSRLTTMKWAS